MVLGGGLCLGIFVALSMKKRVDELRQIERIINYIEGELRYKNALLAEACKAASLRCGQPFRSWLQEIGKNLEETRDLSFSQIWDNSLSILEKDTALKKEDIKELSQVGQTLGYLDMRAQEAGLSLYKEQIHNGILNLDKALANNMKIAVILGGLGGVFLVIILL